MRRSGALLFASRLSQPFYLRYAEASVEGPVTGIRFAFFGALSAAALQPVAARADVLEIGSDGARWIAGGNASANPAPAPPVAQAPAVPTAALADPSANARAIPPAYAAKVHELAARYDLSPALIEAVVWQESRWRAGAVSPVGARGLAQLMPGTAQGLGVDPDDPMANLEGGARYLREQLNRFGGDLEKALAAYNAGPGRVQQAGGVPRIRETQSYVAAVIGRLSDHARR
jgi:soluble lytic murein transglycosylase-like protein